MAKWTAHNDARDYVITGDPAVRLLLGGEAGNGGAAGSGRAALDPGGHAPPPPVEAVVHFGLMGGGDTQSDEKEKKAMANEQIVPVPQIGAAPAGAKPARFGDSLMGRLGEFLEKALKDATSLEVRTFTSNAAEAALATTGDPLAANTRLRAFTRIAIDGDTDLCVPLHTNGEPDEALWKLHSAAVADAREDRRKTIAAVISALKELTGR